MLDGGLAVATLAGCAALALAYLAPVIPPDRWAVPALAGLAAPILYLIVALAAGYWAVRRSRWVFVPLALLLVGTPRIGLYARWPGDDPAPAVAEGRDTLRVMTWNVEGFVARDPATGGSRSTAAEIADYIRSVDPDIVCLQEFQSTPAVSEADIDRWLAAWPYRRTPGGFGVAVYSKYPIAGHTLLRFGDSGNGMLRADVVWGADTLHVFCNHLETTHIRRDDIAFLQPAAFAGEHDKRGRIRGMASRLRRGFTARVAQADTVAARVAAARGPSIVCGDFNDTPLSYVYRTIRGNHADAFAERGRGYGFTYKSLYRLLRIDYVLPSSHFETLSYRSPATGWSDHNPVIVEVARK